MEPVFTKSFFKFFFGFVFIIVFGLLGIVFSNRYFSAKETMIANPSEVR